MSVTCMCEKIQKMSVVLVKHYMWNTTKKELSVLKLNVLFTKKGFSQFVLYISTSAKRMKEFMAFGTSNCLFSLLTILSPAHAKSLSIYFFPFYLFFAQPEEYKAERIYLRSCVYSTIWFVLHH